MLLAFLSHLELVPSWAGGLPFLSFGQAPFVSWDHIRDGEQRACPASPPAALLSMAMKHKLMSHSHRDGPPLRCTHRVLKEKPKQGKDHQGGGAVTAGCPRAQACSRLCSLGQEKQIPLPCPRQLVGCPGTPTLPAALRGGWDRPMAPPAANIFMWE